MNEKEPTLKTLLDAAVNSCLGAEDSNASLGYATTGRQRERTITTVVEVHADRDFSAALMHARSGKRITRAGWNAGGQHVEAQYPAKGSRMSAPYLVLKNAQNELVPWVPSQGDLFAQDWALLP